MTPVVPPAPDPSPPAPDAAARLRDLRELLQVVASERDVAAILAHIAVWVERVNPGALCSVLLLDPATSRVRHAAAPSLPAEFLRQIDGMAIGPDAGTCGTAAHRGEPVITADIETDPLWERYRHIALPFALRACWSHPIIASSGEVLGTFALYRHEPGTPTDEQWRLVVDVAQLAALVIERDRAEARRLAHEREMAAILANASDLIVRLDPARRLTFANPAALRVLGRPLELVLGRTATELGIRAEAYAPWEEALRVAQESARDQRVDAHSVERGAELWREATITPEFSAEGVLASFVIVARDFTGRRRTELRLRESDRRLHAILDTTTRVIALLDSEGAIVELGRPTELVLGIPHDVIVGLPLWDTPIFRDLVESQQVIRGAVERAALGRSARGEVAFRYPDGRVRLATYAVRPIVGAGGEITQLIVEGEDVTEGRALEERVRQTEKMESLGRLAGGIAHDFNNILTAIQGNAELLATEARALGDRGGSAPLEQLFVATRRARDLVRQILAFSRKSTMAQVPIDLGDLVSGVVRLLRAGLPATVELRASTPAEQLAILGEATQVSQVILNLAANAEYAMRETREGVLEISLSREVLDATSAAERALVPSTYARLAVSDSGVGIAPDTAAMIFEPFFSTKPVGEGTGMGLAVVHGIVTAHNGAVRVVPRAERGTTVEVYFPVIGEAAAPGASDLPAGPEPGAGRLLVVDDEAPIRALLARHLSRRGYEVLCYASPLEALARVRSDPSAVDAVVTDLTMPGMSGEALIVALRSLRPGLPIVLCSGHAPEMARRFPGPPVEFVAKPFEMGRLVEAIERARGEGGESGAGK